MAVVYKGNNVVASTDSTVIAKLTSRANDALRIAGEHLLQEYKEREVIPYKTGKTQKSHKLLIKDLRRGVVTLQTQNVKYAPIIYRGISKKGVPFKFNPKHNRNARARWFEAIQYNQYILKEFSRVFVELGKTGHYHNYSRK